MAVLLFRLAKNLDNRFGRNRSSGEKQGSFYNDKITRRIFDFRILIFSLGDFEFHSNFKAELLEYSLWQILFFPNVESRQLFERIEMILELPAILYHLK